MRYTQNMKECNDCGLSKPVEDFNWRSKQKGTKQPYCRDCQRKRNRQDYRENSSRWEKNNRRYKTSVRQYVYDTLKNSECIECGETRIACLEFDHRDRADKTLSISKAVTQGWSIKRLEEEIKKCDIRCSNCHSIRTAEQMGWYVGLER